MSIPIEERLEALEQAHLRLRRRVRRLQGALVGVAALAGAGLVLGDAIGQGDAGLPGWGLDPGQSARPPVAEVVRARRFEVVGNDERKFVAAMGVTSEGHGFFESWSNEGTRSARLGSDEDGSGFFTAYARDGFASAKLVTTPTGADLRLNGEGGRPLFEIHADERGDATWKAYNAERFESASLHSRRSGAGTYLQVFGREGRSLVDLGADEKGQGELVVRNDRGASVVRAGTDAQRNARLSLANAEGLELSIQPQLPLPEDVGDMPPVPEHLREDAGAAPTAP